MKVEKPVHSIIWNKKQFMESNNERLKEIILKAFSFLEEEHNYSVICKETEKDIFIDSFEVEYTNSILRREISISYSKGMVNNIVRHTFAISIVRLPYVGVEDFFVLVDYLKAKGVYININFDNHLEEHKVETRLNEIAKIMKSNVIEVIKGEQWYEKFYPRID